MTQLTPSRLRLRLGSRPPTTEVVIYQEIKKRENTKFELILIGASFRLLYASIASMNMLKELLKPEREEAEQMSYINGFKFHSSLDKQSIEQHDTSEFQQFRPLLDAVDKLRSMSITEEGISLPTIVVVGDQSHGKSSVLESLARVDLPRGEGTVTRVPLVLRLQNSAKEGNLSQVTIQYAGKEFSIDEKDISASVEAATEELAGSSKDIVNKPIILHVKKPDAPDLTMVDLPGITRVPMNGQPENISEQITATILEHITPADSIVLNVVQASVDFSTCESIRLSRQVDKTGERTLLVVTKVDKSPDNLFDKVTAFATSIGLGYCCVRNRTPSDRSYSGARNAEAKLFKSHPELRKFDECQAGVPSLAKQLTRIQAQSIQKSLPKVVDKIVASLSEKKKELSRIPRKPADEQSANSVYTGIFRALRRSMEDLMMRGDFNDADKKMHYSARCHELFEKFSESLSRGDLGCDNIDELLKETRGLTLPNFLNFSLFQHFVVQAVAQVEVPCAKLISEIHDYAGWVASEVIDKYTAGYPKMRAIFRKKLQEAVGESRKFCDKSVARMLDKERSEVFTFNHQALHLDASDEGWDTNSRAPLGRDKLVNEMQGTLQSYWKLVKCRLTDNVCLELKYTVKKAILERWDDEISMQDNKLELLMEEPQLKQKRESLDRSIAVLQKCYDIVMEASLGP